MLTIGSTANQNGTALFEGVTVLFLAQFYGVHLDLGQQLTVVFICILGGIGTAGVPAGSIPVVVMILGLVGVPPEGIGMILGVDRFLDMCRTTINVTGDLAAVHPLGTDRGAHSPEGPLPGRGQVEDLQELVDRGLADQGAPGGHCRARADAASTSDPSWCTRSVLVEPGVPGGLPATITT